MPAGRKEGTDRDRAQGDPVRQLEDLTVSFRPAVKGKASRALRAPLAVMAVGLVALAGCGSSSKSTSSSTPSASEAATTTKSTSSSPVISGATVSLTANPEGQLKYDKTSVSAKAGSVLIAFTNNSPLAHNVTIESSSGSKVGATPTFQGGSKTLTVSLKAGTYKFFCSVPGHRQAGMEGTLTVQ